MSRFAVALLIVALGGTCLAQAPVASHAPSLPMAPSEAPANANAAYAAVSPAVPPSTVVARVNGVALTQADLAEQEKAYFPYFREHSGRIPPSAEPEVRSMAMHKMVLDELVYQDAVRRHLKLPEAKLQQGLRDLRQNFKSPDEYNAAIAKKFGSEAAFEHRIRRGLLIRQLWDAEVTRKLIVTDAELRAYYMNNRARFVRPQAVSIQSISFLFPKDATEQQKREARKRADETLPKARAAKNYDEFGVLAEKVSEDDWRVMMGDHKWTHRGEVDPQFELIFSMKPGETTGVLESKEGFHILRVNACQAKRQMTFTEIRDSLRKELEKKRRDDRAQAFEKLLKKDAKIKIEM